MTSARLHAKGFTLIASLLLMLLLSGIAIGLMMMVNTEGKVGSTDLQNDYAFHAAEGGIEKMTSDLAFTFQNAQSPNATAICNVSTMQPTMVGITWQYYNVAPASGCTGALTANFGQISSGPNQGLWAQIIPINMMATAATLGGQEVSMSRNAQVALIPVFQFGVFSESDLGFYSSPNLDFAGRVATNGDLYLGVATCCTLTFHDKLSAYGNVVTAVLPNGLAASSYNDSGTVLIPTGSQGCDATPPSSKTCRAIAQSEGSVVGAGGNPPQSSQNTKWTTISQSTYNGEIIDGDYGASNCGSGKAICGTGAKKLSLPFVNGTTFPYQIIRQPPAGENPTSALGSSREYNMAQIHVLLADDPSQLPGGSADAANIRLANITGASPSYPYGIATSHPSSLPALGGGSTYNTYFATGSNGVPDTTSCNNTYCPTANSDSTLPSDWPYGPATPAAGAQTLVPAGAPIMSGAATNAPPSIWLCPPPTVAGTKLPAGCSAAAATYPYYVSTPTTTWNLIDGYLRVEYKDKNGNWNPVTAEWLQLGFARNSVPPVLSGANAPNAGTNTVNPDAILLLQEPSDRSGDGNPDQVGLAPKCNKTVSGVCTQWSNPRPPEVVVDAASTSPYFGVTNSATTTQSVTNTNWYPINFYDAREGEPRDVVQTNNSCTANGVMSTVEIDVGNLKRWIAGSTGTSGTKVDYLVQNGYVLYFSDRRGMLPNPNGGGVLTGDSGLEDVVNASSAAGTPDGKLEPIAAGQALSPEDVNENGVLDEFGTANMGLGFYNNTTNINASIIAASPDNPYTPRITSCLSTGRKNWVSGARHVLRLVDGTLGNLPASPATPPGGFTVAAENPVYILGDYNTNAGDSIWNSTPTDATGHVPAAVLGDAVTMLSDSWTDLNSMSNVPADASSTASPRQASTTWYRVAIAGGKNMNFPFPSWENSTSYGFGTDGGVHNFLRFLEDWADPGATLNYMGSLVSLYYATYNTGVFKCCAYSVYQPPVRNYVFDSDFTNPGGLPPGTPMFRDVDSLGYRQIFTSRAAGQ